MIKNFVNGLNFVRKRKNGLNCVRKNFVRKRKNGLNGLRKNGLNGLNFVRKRKNGLNCVRKNGLNGLNFVRKRKNGLNGLNFVRKRKNGLNCVRKNGLNCVNGLSKNGLNFVLQIPHLLTRARHQWEEVWQLERQRWSLSNRNKKKVPEWNSNESHEFTGL